MTGDHVRLVVEVTGSPQAPAGWLVHEDGRRRRFDGWLALLDAPRAAIAFEPGRPPPEIGEDPPTRSFDAP